MKKFGDNSKFLIQYEFLKNETDDHRALVNSFGRFEFIIDGRDICQYKINNKNVVNTWYLLYLVDWFCDNLKYILEEDPFPLDVPGETIVEKIENSLDYDSDDDEEFDMWFQKKDDWLYRHSWYSYRGGFYWPDIIIYRNEDNIIICWDNRNIYKEMNIEYVVPSGEIIIEIEYFKQVVITFLNDFFDNLLKRIPQSFNGYQEQVDSLKKMQEKLNFINIIK